MRRGHGGSLYISKETFHSTHDETIYYDELDHSVEVKMDKFIGYD